MLNFIFDYWIQIFFGLIVSGITYIIKRIVGYKKKIDNLSDSIELILKIKISETYENLSNKDCITMYEKQLIDDVYTEYKKMGGNGFTEDLMENIERIPVKSDCR